MAPSYDTYVWADGGHIGIGPIEPQFYQLLLQRLGLEGDPDFTGDQWDRRAWPQRRARLAALFLQHPQAHWQALLEGTDACFPAVLSPKAALHHPHLQARGVYAEPQGTLQASPAPRFGAAPYPINPTHPAGAHTEAVLQDLAQGGRGWRA